MLYGDYHTHTTYSHGIGSVMDSAKVAKQKGLKDLAITDHGFNHMFYAIKRSELENLKKDIKEAEAETGVKIYLGVEANIISFDGDIDMIPSDYNHVEWLVVGFHNMVKTKIGAFFSFILGNIFANFFHLVSKKRIKRNTESYIKAVKKNKIDVISHLNYICKVNCYEVAKACAETNTLIELNGKRIHFSKQEVEDMLKTDVMFILDSDAHSPEKIGEGGCGIEMINNYNIPKERIINYNQTIKPKVKQD
jgi:putative hydrolase